MYFLVLYSTRTVGAFCKGSANPPPENSNLLAFHFQTYSKITNCTFHQTTATKKNLAHILSQGPDILYILIELDDTRYQKQLVEKKDVVLPLEWQLAAGVRGRTLLRFPYMFKSMSLWTLSPSVFKTTLRFENINQSCPNFFEDDIDLNQRFRESLISLSE